MKYQDSQNRKRIDKVINISLNHVLNESSYFDNEYEFSQGDWSLDNQKVNHGINPMVTNNEPTYGYGINANDEYKIVKMKAAHSRWHVAIAQNGMQAWVDKKLNLHPVHKDLGWFDHCSDFNGTPFAKGFGIFTKKNKRNYAIGLKDNKPYRVYADGAYEFYKNYHNYRQFDANGNKVKSNYFDEGRVNSDGTYTTDFITDPQNSKYFDPNRFLRIKFPGKKDDLLRQFYYIWGNSQYGQSMINSMKVGYNDNGSSSPYYFIDMPNKPGIYDKVLDLYINLQKGNIKFNQNSKEMYKDIFSVHRTAQNKPYGINENTSLPAVQTTDRKSVV